MNAGKFLSLFVDWLGVCLQLLLRGFDGNSLFESVNQPESVLGDDLFLLGQLFQL